MMQRVRDFIGGPVWRFWPFWLFLGFFKFSAGMHYSLISPLGEELLPLWVVGLLMGGGSLLQLLLDVPAGHIMDRYGYLKFLKVTTVAFFVAGACLMFGLTDVTYILSIVFATVGWLFFGPGVDAYVLSHAPKPYASRFIAQRDIFDSVGVVFSSAALPLVLAFSPYATGLLLVSFFGLALFMLFLSPRDTVSAHHEIKIPTHHHFVRRNYFATTVAAIKKLNPASSMLLLLGLASSTFYGIIWFVVPLVIAHEAHAGALSIGLGVFDFAIVMLGFFLGKLADTLNRSMLVFFGLLLFSVAGIALGFNFGWLFILFGFLATTGDEMASVSLWSWLHALDRTHDHDGAVAGVINLFQDIGWAIGPAVAGLLYGVVGPSWSIALGAIPIVLTLVWYKFFMYRAHGEGAYTHDIPQKPHKRRHRR